MMILTEAKIIPIQLLGYYQGKQCTRSVSVILRSDEDISNVESLCMDIARDIYYDTNKDPFGEFKTRRFTIKVGRKKLRVNTTKHYMAFVADFKKKIIELTEAQNG